MAKKIEIDEEKMLSLYHEGLSNSAIGRHFGIGHNGISRRLEKYGLTSHKLPSALVIKDGKIQCVVCSNFMDKNDYELRSDGRAWRRQCKVCRNRRTVLRRYSNDERKIKSRLSKYKSNSIALGLPCDLDYEYLLKQLEFQNRQCFYSDEPLIFPGIGEGRNGRSPTVDRIVPERGYVKGNVVWCIEKCNRMKNDATIDELKIWMPNWYSRIQKYRSTLTNFS